MNRFNWTEIHEIPNGPGIYAWYYAPEITNFDLEQTIKLVRKKKEDGYDIDAKKEIEEFLEKFIFNYFVEEPYLVSIKGPLKPEFSGKINHKQRLSEALILRIVENPIRLKTIKDIIEKSAPDFASPIYIGMSENIRQRVTKHKRLIEKYFSENNLVGLKQITGVGTKDVRDHNFAWQIKKRAIPPSRLFVTIKQIAGEDRPYIDIENILNRIQYPLLGRN
ncbi:hypothetical protein GF1_15990 [Desulfolithobacter dissulfuricans]|uniref:GIY-YIG domain-containing protein n=1 Tax=Desulfolithobacter dissulfuricans TaxID=2795293 RepID=A0A915XKH4_9BACT|nr:hypothetical protein [Desulfolithobacter dissulfuricans]BCO09223.1 hypothetical protein GF1_15990 [Desulfolithobacter dissulfuricans]